MVPEGNPDGVFGISSIEVSYNSGVKKVGGFGDLFRFVYANVSQDTGSPWYDSSLSVLGILKGVAIDVSDETAVVSSGRYELHLDGTGVETLLGSVGDIWVMFCTLFGGVSFWRGIWG
jgi:hypothetical protein